MPCPCRLLVTGCQSTDLRLIQAIAASVDRHIEPHDLPLLAGELHANQMNRLAAGAVFGGVRARPSIDFVIDDPSRAPRKLLRGG